MKKALTTLFICGIISGTQAQTLNFSEDIASIIYSNCTSCHRSGGIAPFAMESYNDVVVNSTYIPGYIAAGIMPPWPPDSSYQHYANERVLSTQEVDDITSWISNGMPEGDPALAPDPPVFIEGSVLGVPDLKIQAPVYTSKAAFSDEYVCFSIPINISSSKVIRAIEVIPGNRAIVHHALAYYDGTGTFSTDTTSGCLGVSGADLITAYVPGAGPTIFPSQGTMNMGMPVEPNSNLVLQIHYPGGSAGLKDSTYVNLFFYPDSITNVRTVAAAPILSNWGLVIPANTTQTFTAQYPQGAGTIPANFSILTVFPHMHLLGQSIESYAVLANNDTLPFARINKWDFEWQGFYNFKKPVVLTGGSKMYAEATYDNTTANPNNPSNPPQLVIAGESTTDEMFLVYFHYVLYQPGDENLDLESLLTVSTFKESRSMEKSTPKLVSYPNPFSTSTTLEYFLKQPGKVTLRIVDVLGRQVKNIDLSQGSGLQTYTWNGEDTDGARVKNGLYFIQLEIEGEKDTRQAVIIRSN